MENKPSIPANNTDSQQRPKGKIDSQVFIQVSKDESSATITVIPPQPGGKLVAEEDIRLALATAGVVYGVKEETVANIIANPPKDDVLETVIATGEKGEPGVDASIEFFIDINKKEKELKPEELEDGRIDYYNISSIQNVTKGKQLARKIPATPGKPGKSVTGKETPPVPGKDISVVVSKGVEKSPDDENLFLAAIDGQVAYNDKKLQVLSIYEVKGDVDFSIGNIDFVGSVIVHGNVKDDFKIQAGGDILVDGVVEGAQVISSGKVTLKGGVLGHDHAIIKAKGDIVAKYLRNCTAETEKNIVVNEAIMHSKVTAGEKIVVSGKKGLIVGGLTIAGSEITAKVYGSNFATLTELEVGTKPQTREEVLELTAKIQHTEQELDKIKKGLAFLKELATKTPGGLPAPRKEMMAKLTRNQFSLIAELKPLQEQLVTLEREEEKIRLTKKGRIIVMGMMNTGVKITIQKAYRQVNEELKYCTILEDNGEIKIGPYKG